MNLVTVTQLINHPEVQADKEMKDMYIRKREELVISINEGLANLGVEALTLKQLLLASPSPSLAETV